MTIISSLHSHTVSICIHLASTFGNALNQKNTLDYNAGQKDFLPGVGTFLKTAYRSTILADVDASQLR